MANRKVKFDFNPLTEYWNGDDLTRKLDDSQKKNLLDDIANYVLDSVLSRVGDSSSPVAGQPARWKGLSAEYAKSIGKKPGAPSTLELHGDLLDSIKVVRNGTGLRLTVDESEQPKADGHNNFSGKSNLPRRAFVPDEKRGEDFRPDIKEGIREVIQNFLDDEGV